MKLNYYRSGGEKKVTRPYLFADLEVGDIFGMEGINGCLSLYMKTALMGTAFGVYNSVCLSDGTLTEVEADWYVHRYTGEVDIDMDKFVRVIEVED